MKTPKIILPAISVGLLITAREVTAGVIDFGLIGESLVVAGTVNSPTGAGTIGGYTLSALQFVGSHLNDIINGQTVSAILTADLGPQNAGTVAFNFLGNQGASGSFILNGTYAVVSGGVTINSPPVTGTLTSCTPGTPPPLPGCLPGTQVPINPYDPAGFITNLEAAQILALPPGLRNEGTMASTGTVTIDLGSVNGTDFQGEEINTVVNVVAGTPEPSSWSFGALGVAGLGWWRRHRSRQA